MTISSVNFTSCGTTKTYEIEHDTKYEYMAAIHLHWSRNVTIYNVSVTGNNGAGLAIIDPQGGAISISYSQFSRNRVPPEFTSKYYGGAGVYVRDRRAGEEEDQVQLQLSQCTFEHNQATFPFTFSIFNIFNRPHLGTGRGGGTRRYSLVQCQLERYQHYRLPVSQQYRLLGRRPGNSVVQQQSSQ